MNVLDEADFIARYDKQNVLRELGRATSGQLAAAAAEWGPEVVTADNAAKQIAAELVGRVVVVYAGSTLAEAGRAWRRGLNETAQQLAFCEALEGLSDAALELGWRHPRDHGLKVVALRSELDDEPVGRRFESMNRWLSNRFAPIQIWAQGETPAEQAAWTQLFGAFVAAYLAILNQVTLDGDNVVH